MPNSETGILLTPIKRITLAHGDVLRGLKASDSGFNGFGETYFSYIHYQDVKAWKKHKRHTANFICPMGKIKVVVMVDNTLQTFILSDAQEHYARLTLPPGFWYGFEGLSQPSSLIFSLLNGEHAQEEQESKDMETFPLAWPLSSRTEYDQNISETLV